MKKVILSVLAISLGASGFAQKKNVNTAQVAIVQKEYDDAKAAIDAATQDETTKNEAKTWFVYGDVYNTLATQDKYKDLNGQLESAKGYMKALEIDPKYNKDEMTNRLDFAMRVYFNEGLHAMNEKKYKEAYEYLAVPVTIKNLDGGKRFPGKMYDTIASMAQLNQGYAAYFGEEYDKALPELKATKDNPIVATAAIYQLLTDIYTRQGNEAEANKAIEEGIAKYPDNKDLRNIQLNAVIKSGKLDDLVKKLEENVANEPDNPETLYMLGITYYNMATPRDNSGKDLPKPANYDELLGKAEKAYLSAIAKDKKGKPEYSYNLGVVYFNQASDINKKMSALGSSAAENKKFDELKVQRDAMFVKALEPLEKVYNSLDPKATAGTLSADEKATYTNTLVALKEIYGRTSQFDKSKAIKQKLADMK